MKTASLGPWEHLKITAASEGKFQIKYNLKKITHIDIISKYYTHPLRR